MGIRRLIYEGHLTNYDYLLGPLILDTPTGFTFNSFVMGYQAAVCVTMVILLIYADQRRWSAFWLASLPVGIVGLVLSTQRSAILAVLLAVSIMIVLRKKWVYILSLTMAGVICLFAINFTSRLDLGNEALASKLQGNKDAGARLSWQVAAVRIVLENPLGNLLGGNVWQSEAEDYGADFDTYYGGQFKAAHNAYLNVMLKLGWVGVLIVLSSLWLLWTKLIYPAVKAELPSRKSLPHKFLGTAYRNWNQAALACYPAAGAARQQFLNTSPRIGGERIDYPDAGLQGLQNDPLCGRSKRKSLSYFQVCALSLVAALSNALFHNQSIFTLEYSSWIIFCIAHGWLILITNPHQHIQC